MTIAFNWVNSLYNAAAATSVAVAKGANTTTAGDFLVVFVAIHGATDPGAITPPAGWTIAQPNSIAGAAYNSGSTVRFGAFFRIADGTEGSTFTFSWTTSSSSSWAILDYTGVNATPFDGGAETDLVGGTFSTNIVAPAITTANANDFEVCMWAAFDGSTPYTVPVVMTSRANLGTGGGSAPLLIVADLSIPTSGSQGTQTATRGNSDNNYNTVSFGIKPSTGAARTPTLMLMGVG